MLRQRQVETGFPDRPPPLIDNNLYEDVAYLEQSPSFPWIGPFFCWCWPILLDVSVCSSICTCQFYYLYLIFLLSVTIRSSYVSALLLSVSVCSSIGICSSFSPYMPLLYLYLSCLLFVSVRSSTCFCPFFFPVSRLSSLCISLLDLVSAMSRPTESLNHSVHYTVLTFSCCLSTI